METNGTTCASERKIDFKKRYGNRRLHSKRDVVDELLIMRARKIAFLLKNSDDSLPAPEVYSILLINIECIEYR